MVEGKSAILNIQEILDRISKDFTIEQLHSFNTLNNKVKMNITHRYVHEWAFRGGILFVLKVLNEHNYLNKIEEHE